MPAPCHPMTALPVPVEHAHMTVLDPAKEILGVDNAHSSTGRSQYPRGTTLWHRSSLLPCNQLLAPATCYWLLLPATGSCYWLLLLAPGSGPGTSPGSGPGTSPGSGPGTGSGSWYWFWIWSWIWSWVYILPTLCCFDDKYSRRPKTGPFIPCQRRLANMEILRIQGRDFLAGF